MADHAALVPSFRDFSFYPQLHSLGEIDSASEPPAGSEVPKPTVLEVERILKESSAGRLSEAVSFKGWPWLERMGFLEDSVPGIKVHSLGGLAPFEADGVWGPYEWYYRERGGHGELRLAPIATFPGAQEALYSASQAVSEFAGSGGWLRRFLASWENLERAPFLYEFPAKEVYIEGEEGAKRTVVTGENTMQASWGHSPTDAWLEAARYQPFYEEYFGWPKELQEERRELMEISREPSNRDERVYPLDDPDFAVNREALEIPDEFARFFAVEKTSTDS